MVYIDPKGLELEDRVVAINRVTKVVKGGRRLRFAAIVVVGDKNGHVGFGTGKAQEVPEAIRKAIEDAKKNLIEVPMVGSTIPHEVLGVYSGGRTLMKPAVAGSGGGNLRRVGVVGDDGGHDVGDVPALRVSGHSEHGRIGRAVCGFARCARGRIQPDGATSSPHWGYLRPARDAGARPFPH